MVKAVEDWYDTPDRMSSTADTLPSVLPLALNGAPAKQTDFYDDPVSRLDMSKFPSKNAGLPVDIDVVNILAGGDGIASKPDILTIGAQLVTDVQELAAALAQAFGGNITPLQTWISEHLDLSWLPDLSSWVGVGLDAIQTMLNQIADILRGLIVTPINTAVQGVKEWFLGLGDWQTAVDETAQSVRNAIVSGLTGTTVTDASPADTLAAATTVDNRITALEGGGVQLLYGASATVDLTVHPITGDPWYPSEVKVWMWQGGYSPGPGGQFAARTFTTAHLESLGVDLSAFEVVVGAAGGAHSKVGECGSGSYALETTATSYYLNSDGIYQEIPSGVAGGNGGSPGQRRIGTDTTFNGVPVQQSATSGSAGGSTQLAAGGVGGTATQGADSGSNGQGVGGNGSNGESVPDYDNRAFAGGGGGGGGAGGGVDSSAGKKGGNGGNGGWPGGGGGYGAQGGQWYILGVNTSTGSAGASGVGATGVVILEVR